MRFKFTHPYSHYSSALLRIIVPLLLFVFILRSIDFGALGAQFFSANAKLIALTFILYPFAIIIAVTRWHSLIQAALPFTPRWRYLLRHYFVGLGLGYFVPAGLGLDAYRTLAAKEQHNSLASLATVTVFERFLGLASCFLLFVIIYPLAGPETSAQWRGFGGLTQCIYAALALFAIFLIVLYLFRSTLKASFLWNWFENFATQKIRFLLKRFPNSIRAEAAAKSIHSTLTALLTARILYKGLGLSLLVQVLSAIAAWMFFYALSTPLPFLVPLLATPIVFFAVHLPVSFGGLGVRESVYILFYGLYGVAPETALAAALLALAGSLLNVLIGGISLAFGGTYRDSLIADFPTSSGQSGKSENLSSIHRFPLSGLSALEFSTDGIWRSKRARPVSYPESGHASCFQVENDSFWFIHRNACISALVTRYPPQGPLVDVGGGNGVVSMALQECGVETVLIEPGAVGARNAKLRGLKHVVCATLDDIQLPPRSIAAFGLFDVLEHIENDGAFLDTLHTTLIDEGRLFLTVPAFNFLWSEADVLAGHYRRYTRAGIIKLLHKHGFVIDYSTYLFAPLPIGILLFRTLRRKAQPCTDNQCAASTDHRLPRGPLGSALKTALRFEHRLIKSGLRIPFGSTVLVAARRAPG